ncbi:hypothetical protein [Rariglobus hedericola]|uniref:Oligogalacturonate lyase domain-containing protein n=1 Tax=Rariglobus hedericola TaxID=2597822 RepID=A0A556QSG0_9BACT|nr:hypothetical protein [Rariglobus hedericola]TSJ79563.1 hypothetical protein FPL22_09835 [Rariglobus hedericola]
MTSPAAVPAGSASTPDTSLSTPETSPLFSRWINPSNGVASYVLTHRAAPVQQSFYYTHPSWSADGRFLWLGCGFPPEGGMHSQQVLGVVDFKTDELRVYPETQFPTSRPWIDHATGEAWWGNHFDIWKRGPLATDEAVRVGTVPSSAIPGKLQLLATHPTFSADRKSINLDSRSTRDDGVAMSTLGELPLDGSPYLVWQTFENRTFNHALFSPIDPDLQLCAQEYWIDGDRLGIPFDGTTPYHRIWTICRGEEARPLLKAPVSHSGHEWWDASGESIWYLHYGYGVKSVSLATREETLVWPGNLSHAHSTRCGRYLVADTMADPGNADCHVLFYDTVTRREVEIVNTPPLSPGATRCVHLHPHPQFCLDDRYICYTTMVHDRVDIALVPVADLIALTI